MTQEDKELLLKDLCARVPYEVKICVDDCVRILCDIEKVDKLNGKTFYTVGFNAPDAHYNFCTLSEVKPYLRPMSSMTDGEKEIYKCFSVAYGDSNDIMIPNPMSIDFLLWKHFDYRGLIEKELALEAPEGMYEIE